MSPPSPVSSSITDKPTPVEFPILPNSSILPELSQPTTLPLVSPTSPMLSRLPILVLSSPTIQISQMSSPPPELPISPVSEPPSSRIISEVLPALLRNKTEAEKKFPLLSMSMMCSVRTFTLETEEVRRLRMGLIWLDRVGWCGQKDVIWQDISTD